MLITFVTPFGRYRFLRSAFGLAISTEIVIRYFLSYLKVFKAVKYTLKSNLAAHGKTLIPNTAQNVIGIDLEFPTTMFMCEVIISNYRLKYV